jgi:hypothetical protein
MTGLTVFCPSVALRPSNSFNGVPSEYAAAARRYMGDEQGPGHRGFVPGGRRDVPQLPSPRHGSNILDFETRFPSAFPG